MKAVTLNVSFNEDLADFLNGEVRHGGFSTASEAVRQAVREWKDRRVGADLAALESAHAGAHGRDVTDDELGVILAAQREVRSERGARRIKARK